MAYDRAFGHWVRDHLKDLGAIEIKPMFGAAGVKFGGAMFAILDDGDIWLKADEALAAELEAEGSRQFTYSTKAAEVMVMAYWSLPETAVDDADEAVAWARKSVEVALRPKPKRR
ncbi:TfoX/Sxy family protein [Brevundimonas aveniformis]|uniref:TfoX/Sxy family protein n=1 Tax=Brevundimonas aveniformis TaxID=370977 RepID=UPI00248F8E3A|nr:TfoX/Sxy family protein [Brevundimonas aveniformis]